MQLNIVYNTLNFLIILVPVLIAVAYLTLLERKVLGYSQLRKGPNVVGLYGVLQPLADGVKLFSKEMIVPYHANIFLFVLSPVIALACAILPWFIFPWGNNYNISNLFSHKLSILILLAILSLGIFGVMLSGWSSNSKYAFMGSVRAVAQMISYEVSLLLILMGLIMISGSLNLTYIYTIQNTHGWHILPLIPFAVCYFITMLAETNRAPFDLAEGESELVSGYNVEYSGMPFALFFLAEYSHIIFSSFIFVVLFVGNSIGSFWLITAKLSLKGSFVCIIFIWVRTSFPRVRYDQVMSLMWKNILPLSIGLVWLYLNLIGFLVLI